MIRQVHGTRHLFLSGVSGSEYSWESHYLILVSLGKDTTEHKWGRVSQGFLSHSQVSRG